MKEAETCYTHVFIVHLQTIRCRMKSWPFWRPRLPFLVAGEGFHSLLKYEIYSRPHNKIFTKEDFCTQTDIHKERSCWKHRKIQEVESFPPQSSIIIECFDNSIMVPLSRNQENLVTYLSWFRAKKNCLGLGHIEARSAAKTSCQQ